MVGRQQSSLFATGTVVNRLGYLVEASLLPVTCLLGKNL
jgi:hypothetical protein